MKKTILLILLTVLCISCSDDNKLDNKLKTPENYKFLRDNKSSVDYLNQTHLSKMADELVGALRNKTNQITKQKLNGMFNHTKGNSDFKDETLNSSSENLKNSVPEENSNYIVELIEKQADNVFPAWENNAGKGVPGKLKRSTSNDYRHFDKNGLELHEAVEKQFIGALLANTIAMNISKDKLDANSNKMDNDMGKVVSQKNYTAMEHLWDEAYGALYAESGDTGNPITSEKEGTFLSEYVNAINKFPAFNGISKNILDAFKLGRAAIVAKNYKVRDEQAKIIIDNIAKVMAVRCVYYLQMGKTYLAGDKASAFHTLSEGSGFIKALGFVQKNATKTFPERELMGLYSALTSGEDGFWSVTGTKIEDVSKRIAQVYGFTIEQATKK